MRLGTIHSLAVTGALAAVASACATAPPESRQPFLPYQLAPQPADRARQEATAQAVAQDQAAARVHEALIAFAVEQRDARAAAAPGAPMPEAVRARWASLLADVDTFLTRPADRTPPLDLVRARVALDAEISMDSGHYGTLPQGLDAAVHARALALDARLRQIRQRAQGAAPAPTRLSWPLDPVIVTSLFGYRNDPLHGAERQHRGIDLKAATGQMVQAAAAGEVTRAEKAGGYGLHVELHHDDGLVTSYSHLSLLLVQAGQRVPAGGPVGLAGSTGRSTGPHLHFEVWRDGEPVDPLGELPDPALIEGGIYSADGR